MKKTPKLLTILTLCLTLFTGCCLSHDWTEADCVTPKTCAKCGETEGEALEHTWQDTTCAAPKTCTKCGETEGEPLEHTWEDATCTAPKTCTVCNGTEGEAPGHDFTYWYLPTTISNPTEMWRFCRVCDEQEKVPIDYDVMTADFFQGSWQGIAMRTDKPNSLVSLDDINMECSCVFLEDGSYMQIITGSDGSTVRRYGNYKGEASIKGVLDTFIAEYYISATGIDGESYVFFSGEQYVKQGTNHLHYMANLIPGDGENYHVIYTRNGQPSSEEIAEIRANVLQISDVVGTWYREYEYNGKWMESTFIVNEDGTFINEHFTEGQDKPSVSTGVIKIFGNEYRFIEEGVSGWMPFILENNTLVNGESTYERK